MTKKINPLLKQENRQQFIQQAMKAMTDRQNALIKEADEIIGDVTMFETKVHQQFVGYKKIKNYI